MSNVLKGIINANNPKGFNLALSVIKFSWDIRNGKTALFWEDWWAGRERLSTIFSRLYDLSKLKFFMVKEFCEAWYNPETESRMLWTRQLRAWELEEVLKLNELIEELVFTEGDDRVIWKISNDLYCTSDGNSFLRYSGLQSTVNDHEAWSIIWNLKIPPKIQYFFVKDGASKITNKIFPDSKNK